MYEDTTILDQEQAQEFGDHLEMNNGCTMKVIIIHNSIVKSQFRY